MRVIFMGTPEYAVPSLKALHAAGHEIVAVYSQPPRAAGRGKSLRKVAVHDAAEALGLDVLTPENFKDPQEVERFRALDADVAVVIAYGLLLPQAVLDAPKLGAVNLHASLLPKWRGAAPIQRAIMAGDDATGVCLMQMEAGLDTGPVLARREIAIDEADTSGTLHEKLAALSSEIIVENLPKFQDLPRAPQDNARATYARKIEKSEAEIDWALPAQIIKNHIHGLSPFPGAWSSFNGERIKFHQVHVVEIVGEAGVICDDRFTIACGKNAIAVDVLQREGKRAMPIDEVLRGFRFEIGDRLGE